MSKVAFCPRCHEPVVFTLAFRGGNVYCLNCGARSDTDHVIAADATPERLARMHAVERDWATVSDGLIAEGGVRTDCSQCQQPWALSHMDHATEEERHAHEAAMVRLNARAASWQPPMHHGWAGLPDPA